MLVDCGPYILVIFPFISAVRWCVCVCVFSALWTHSTALGLPGWLVGWLAGHINKAQDERRYNKQSIEILKIPINKTIKNIVSTRTPIPTTEKPSLSKGLHRKFHHETIELCLPCALIFSSSVFIYSFFFIFTRIFWHTRTNTHRTQIGIFKVVWGTEVQKREWICTTFVLSQFSTICIHWDFQLSNYSHFVWKPMYWQWA